MVSKVAIESNREKVIRVTVGTGKYSVRGIGIPIDGNGLVVCILGGEVPHVGAVALSVPRAGLRHTEGISATSSVLTLVGHMEDEIAKPASWKIAKELNQVTVVIAGIHIESDPPYHATESELKQLAASTKEVTDKLIAEFKQQLVAAQETEGNREPQEQTP